MEMRGIAPWPSAISNLSRKRRCAPFATAIRASRFSGVPQRRSRRHCRPARGLTDGDLYSLRRELQRSIESARGSGNTAPIRWRIGSGGI
ncbi:hypothetical protein ABIG06_000655 [Bradyrhizobium sp. USDA 326]